MGNVQNASWHNWNQDIKKQWGNITDWYFSGRASILSAEQIETKTRRREQSRQTHGSDSFQHAKDQRNDKSPARNLLERLYQTQKYGFYFSRADVNLLWVRWISLNYDKDINIAKNYIKTFEYKLFRRGSFDLPQSCLSQSQTIRNCLFHG